MKTSIFILPLLLLLNACGSDSSKTDPTPEASKSQASPTPTPSPSPSPSANPCSEVSFLGIWTQAGNDLTFKDDCSATSGAEKLSWNLTPDKFIDFKVDKIDVDSCSYQIESTGGLAASLVITLKLNCDKAGLLNYTKKNQ